MNVKIQDSSIGWHFRAKVLGNTRGYCTFTFLYRRVRQSIADALVSVV